jgi:hypothetical protein
MANPSAIDMEACPRSAGQKLHGQEQEVTWRLLTPKYVVDRAKIRVANLPGKQHFPLESLSQGRLIGDLRKNCLHGDVDALQKAILRLIDLAHAAFCDETDNGETINQKLTGLQSSGRRPRSNLILVERSGGAGGARRVDQRGPEKIKWRVLKLAAGVCILGQQLFDRAS